MGSPSHNYVSTPSPLIGKDHNNLHETEHSQFFVYFQYSELTNKLNYYFQSEISCDCCFVLCCELQIIIFVCC